MARTELPARSPLSKGGVARLTQSSVLRSPVHLQVLGIYRYLADPVLKARLGPTHSAAVERDVFDLLLSDGQSKIKCVLAPVFNQLVWKRYIATLDIISISEVKVLDADPRDDDQVRRIIVICGLTMQGILPNSRRRQEPIVLPASADNEVPGKLKFIPATHPREVELLPLCGHRQYYLPLRSDHYALDWECSFCGGVPDVDSPLDELVEHWEQPRNGNEPSTTLAEQDASRTTISWSTKAEYCSSLFTERHKRIFTLEEASNSIDDMTASNKQYPPMIGTIRVKSQVLHIGDPAITNPFPFVFHIVVVDAASAVEVAFYGSMCARYFHTLQEGDLIQLRGYNVLLPREIDVAFGDSSRVFYYQHDSSGRVYHIPEKYWKLLEMTRVVPPPIPTLANGQSESPTQAQNVQINPTAAVRWLECKFVSTLNTQFWSTEAMDDRERLYFDFVGVLSYVGPIYRRRKRKRAGDLSASDSSEPVVTEYRWIKAIDTSSSQELVIQLDECSQPAVFSSLRAGDVLLATKLQWQVAPSGADDAIEHAVTSCFSVLRVNGDISPFNGLDECRQAGFFAAKIMDGSAQITPTKHGESKLNTYVSKKHHPRNTLPSTTRDFMLAFGLSPLTFRELHELIDSLETYECQQFGLVGRVHSSFTQVELTGESKFFLELEDDTDSRQLKVKLASNPLFRQASLRGAVKTITPAESLLLLRALSPVMVDELVAESLGSTVGSASAAAIRTTQHLTLELISDWLCSKDRKYFFSLHLRRNVSGHVIWTCDAILPAP